MFGPLLEVAMSKKCTRLWGEAHVEVKMYCTRQVRTTFGSWDVEKVHGVVARSTFRSQYVKNTTCSDHFWKLRCRKSARRCGAKHIFRSRKNNGFAPLLDVQMSFCVAGARDCGPCQKWVKKWGFCSIFNYNHHYTTLQLQLHLDYIPLHYSKLHYTTLHYTPLHYTTLHSTALHYIALHSTTLHYNYTTLHYISLHYATFHYTTLLHYNPLHYTTTTLHCAYNYNYNYNYNYIKLH